METFIFSGRSSDLSTYYNPPLYLKENNDYEIALVNFDSFYSIPNIDNTNNTFLWWGEDGVEYTTLVPEGAYEIDNLNDAMGREMSVMDANAVVTIELDQVTSKVTINSNRKCSFAVTNSLGSVLGFMNQTVQPDTRVVGSSEVNILKVNAICIECNIAGSSYLNGKPVHIIHQFFTRFKIVEEPAQRIYHPVFVKAITNISVRVIDQDGRLLNFKDDIRTIRLHLRKVAT